MLLDRFGLQDTPTETQERIYELLRNKTPEQRLLMVISRMAFGRDLRKATQHLRPADENGRTSPINRPFL